ncbi:MAG: helix-turn-helix transcriptional regulator [Limisphaerales bacterium]
MKVRLEPIYRTRRARLGIDRCEPQLRAIREGKIQLQALTKGHYPGQRMGAAVLPGLASIGFWDAIGRQDWGLDPHRNEGIEIVFLETGSMAFTVDQHRHDLHTGHLTITRPWQLHKLGAPNIGPGRLHWLILDVGVRRPNQEWRWPGWVMLTPGDLGDLTRKLRHNENPIWTGTPSVAEAFRGLARCVTRWPEPHSVSRLVIHLNQLLVGVLDALTEQQTEENPELTSRRHTVELFLRDLEHNPLNPGEPWTLERMAAHCGMGITAFSKYCRQIANTGAVEFLNRSRLASAARQLRETPARSITEVALENGFNSSQYFATSFRHRFRMTPREFRERAALKRG